MTPDESEVRAATVRFYEAIEGMMTGMGLEPMKAAWHHTDRVTGQHPSGEWSQGWDEVYATWTVFAGFAAPERGGSSVRDLRVYVYGDTAYTTCIFNVAQFWGGEALACTNILRRIDGAWKIIHHHADKAPKMGAIFERIAQEG